MLTTFILAVAFLHINAPVAGTRISDHLHDTFDSTDLLIGIYPLLDAQLEADEGRLVPEDDQMKSSLNPRQRQADDMQESQSQDRPGRFGDGQMRWSLDPSQGQFSSITDMSLPKVDEVADNVSTKMELADGQTRWNLNPRQREASSIDDMPRLKVNTVADHIPMRIHPPYLGDRSNDPAQYDVDVLARSLFNRFRTKNVGLHNAHYARNKGQVKLLKTHDKVGVWG